MTGVQALTAAGEALHGARWREPLARELCRRGGWQAGRLPGGCFATGVGGQRAVPDWVAPALADLLRQEANARHRTLRSLAESIEASMT